jgi:peptide deformylase
LLEKSENCRRFKTPTMALLPILCYPNPKLHIPAQPVPVVDAGIRQLISDMQETMYDAQGIGLAAPQVGVSAQVLVMDVSEERQSPLVLINPKMLWHSEETQCNEEGCLSVPGIYDAVPRFTQVRVRALDAQGQSREIEAQGLLAVCIQHEMDHLLGKVFVQYLSPLKRNRIQKKMLKALREGGR